MDERHRPVVLVARRRTRGASPSSGHGVGGDEVDGVLLGVDVLPELHHADAERAVAEPGARHDVPAEAPRRRGTRRPRGRRGRRRGSPRAASRPRSACRRPPSSPMRPRKVALEAVVMRPVSSSSPSSGSAVGDRLRRHQRSPGGAQTCPSGSIGVAAERDRAADRRRRPRGCAWRRRGRCRRGSSPRSTSARLDGSTSPRLVAVVGLVDLEIGYASMTTCAVDGSQPRLSAPTRNSGSTGCSSGSLSTSSIGVGAGTLTGCPPATISSSRISSIFSARSGRLLLLERDADELRDRRGPGGRRSATRAGRWCRRRRGRASRSRGRWWACAPSYERVSSGVRRAGAAADGGIGGGGAAAARTGRPSRCSSRRRRAGSTP